MLSPTSKIDARATSCSTPTLPDEPYFRRGAARLLPAAAARAVRRARSTTTRCAARSSPPSWSTSWSTAPASRSSSGRSRRPAATPVEVARAYAVVREVFGLPDFWARGRGAGQPGADRRADGALPGVPPPDRPGDALARLQSGARCSTSTAEIERLRGRSRALAPQIPRHAARRRARARCSGARAELVGAGRAARPGRARPRRCWTRFCCSTSSRSPQATGRAADEVGRAATSRCPSSSRSTGARSDHRPAARRPLVDAGPDGAALRPVRRAGRAHRATCSRRRRRSTDPDERIAAWAGAQRRRVCAGPGRRCSEIATADSFDLATLSVALRVIRTLVPSGSSG